MLYNKRRSKVCILIVLGIILSNNWVGCTLNPQTSSVKPSSQVSDKAANDANKQEVVKNKAEATENKVLDNNDKEIMDKNTNNTSNNQEEEAKNNQDTEEKKQAENNSNNDQEKQSNINQSKNRDFSKLNNIKSSANEYAVSADIVSKMIKGKYNEDEKNVFLTFDDGPSQNTAAILNILKREGVHATFFVVGKNVEDGNEHLVKQAFQEGNAIGNHTYSHNYKYIYPKNSVNVGNFINEVEKTNTCLERVLGDNFHTNVIRMPGGYVSRKYYNDPHIPDLKIGLKNIGVVSIDWNAENGDAKGKNYSAQQLINYTIKESRGINNVIVLMHDSGDKKETVKALTGIIKYFKNNNYQFKVIKNS